MLKSKTIERYLTDEIFRGKIDHLFQKVEPYVIDFANVHKLSLDKWYHDLPVWTLHWQKAGVTRLLQITAAQSKDMPALSIAVYAYRDVEAEKVRYGMARAQILGPIPANELETNPISVKYLLDKAFSIATSLSEQDLTESVGFTRP